MQEKIKKLLKLSGLILGTIVVFTMILFGPELSYKAFTGSLPLSEQGEKIISGSDIPTPPSEASGQDIAEIAVINGLSIAKAILAVFGILYATISGLNLVLKGDEEDQVGNAKKAITYIIIAFVLVSMSQDIARIFDMRDGTLLGSPQEILGRARLFDRQIEIFITFVKYSVGGFATVFALRSGLKLITAGAESDQADEHKRGLWYSSIALVFLFAADIFINRVFFKVNKDIYSGINGVDPKIDAKEGVEQIVGITNFIVSWLGPLLILLLIVAAVLYATGQEEQIERAKRIGLASAIGLLIIFGAFAIVSTVLAGKLEDLGALNL